MQQAGGAGIVARRAQIFGSRMVFRQILVMRHGEKSGDPKDPDLADAGRLRATRLVAYIPATFGVPDFLIATAISKHSARPIETLMPLSDAIKIAIDSSYADQDYGALASDLLSEPRYAGRSVVVCWHHGNIPPLMHALGAKKGSYPNPWDAAVFNLILKLDFTHANQAEQIIEPF